MSKAEDLIIEFHEQSKAINEYKKYSARLVGKCTNINESDYDATCITDVIKNNAIYNSGGWIDWKTEEDVCDSCLKIIDNAEKRKALQVKRGYTKNKIHALAKKLNAGRK